MKGFLKEWGGSLVFLLDTKFASMSEDIFRVHTVGRRLFDWIYLQMGVLEKSLSCGKINQKCSVLYTDGAHFLCMKNRSGGVSFLFVGCMERGKVEIGICYGMILRQLGVNGVTCLCLWVVVLIQCSTIMISARTDFSSVSTMNLDVLDTGRLFISPSCRANGHGPF